MKQIIYSADSLQIVAENRAISIFEMVSPGKCNTTSGAVALFDYDEQNDFENPKLIDYASAGDLISELENLEFGTYNITDSRLDSMRFDLDPIEAIIDDYIAKCNG